MAASTRPFETFLIGVGWPASSDEHTGLDGVRKRRPKRRAGPHGRRPRAGTRYPGAVRIIAGQWRGRRLQVPHLPGLRPTPDRVRETLFNWLRPYLLGARCLDLFAGTGALCLEALSRGAQSAVMVETAAAAAAALRANAARLGADRAEVIEAPAMHYLAGTPQPFDIVFIDPPFASDLIARTSALLEERGWLSRNALIYVEAPAALHPLPLPNTWEGIRSGTAGQVGYHLFMKRR